MATDAIGDAEKRVLILPPTARDGELTRSLLAREGLSSVICKDIAGLAAEVGSGVGAVLLTEDAVSAKSVGELLALFQNQPSWSDIPVIVLMRGGGASQAGAQLLRSLGNVTLLERPAPMRSVTSAVQAAVRARLRQYQIRDQLFAIGQAEMRARDLREQLSIALDASSLGTFHCDMPLGKMVLNDQCKAHFWLPPDAEIDFDGFYSILHPDDRVRTRNAVEDSVRRGKSYDIEYRAISPEGKVRWVRATGRAYYNEKNEPLRFDGTTQDVTERKNAESELAETQDRFKAMANSIPQLAWMAKPDGWIFWYNDRWHAYCGSTPEQMEGWGWQSVHDREKLPSIIAKWKAAVVSGQPWEDTFPLRRHDGEFRWHLSRAQPFRDASNNVVLWFGTNTDITEERNRAEEREALLKSEQSARAEAERASRMKDEFLATLSHELRTPLNAILGWSHLLRRDGHNESDRDTLQEGLTVIERNARMQTQLIEDLLDMSRIISGKVRLDVQTVNPCAVIEAAIETVTPAAAAKGIRLQKVLDGSAGPISGDPNRLQQVVWNLLSNAIKFTPKGGRVQATLERVNSHIEITVTDTGNGIAPDFLPHVFERFRQADGSTTRRYGGLGLGLAIVKHLVELHGGNVRVKSPGEGQGSTFTVDLPLVVVHREHTEEKRVHPRTPQFSPLEENCTSLQGLKVLVVDDEPDARSLIKRLLEECKAVVFTAGSAAEALPIIERDQPDVLLSDIGMPETDGYEFLRQVRALGSERGGKLPAIALTAFARSEDRTRALLAGYLVHVAKPVEPHELIATVASVGGRT